MKRMLKATVDRPTNATDSVSLMREWLYNNRSELAVATIGMNHYGYSYDTIGNRLWSADNIITNSYSANNLNQYTTVGRPAPSAPQTSLAYDADGNMTRDGAYTYSYDAENRLRSVTSRSMTNGAIRVLNAYNHRNRRIRKTVQRLSLSIAQPPALPVEIREWLMLETHTFVWDGNNIVLEKVEFANGTIRTFEYFWGPDKSGTEEGAGGVGGLLAVSRNDQFYFPTFDNNGNVTRYIDESGNVVAAYEYDDFGRTISQSGPLADFFRHRFSTKYYDPETGDYYYINRFYSPDWHVWLNRDPIGEMGGCLLYGFCSNNPLISFDLLGQYELTLISDDTSNGDVLMWYLHSNAGNVIHSNIHSANQLLDVIRRENYRRGSPITVLNLSGHGLTSGSGISFEKGKGFDVGKSYKELWPYLAENAVIRIWSCNAASTWQKCNNLRNAAIELDATIYANTGEVYSGPDGNLLSRVSRRVVAWITGESEGEWRVFTPLPKIHAEGFRPAPRAFRILREEFMK